MIPRARLPLLLLAGLLAGGAGAAEAQERLDVESDSAEFDQAAGTATFIGNVVATRGETRLTGERLHAHQDASGLEYAELEGDPGTVRHVSPEGERVEGEARRIVYRPADGRLDLHGDARVVRGRETFSGDHIRYLLDDDRITAEGEGPGRVRTTLFPEREEDERE